MAQVCRRVILKPDGLTPEQDTQLGELLSGAVRLQTELAGKSAHVLHVNGLKSDDRAYYIEHEPATPLPVAPLFNSDQPASSPEELLKVAVALLDSLKAAHEFRQQGRASVHGGLCPGVILTAEGGIVQITDFDIARCICTALGADSYLNLAVGPPPSSDGPFKGATGVWQVLPPEVTDRDDRICAFIDPAKFAQGRPNAFEPPSDIASAGFILHLLAEHHHPYFHDETTIQRDINMFQQMVLMVMPAAIRRKDLRELAKIDPAMKAWWELVPQMVNIVADGRPTAAAGLKQLIDVGLRPADATTIALGRFEEFVSDAAGKSLEDTAWWAAADDRLRAFPGLPLEKAREADAIRKLAEAIARLPTSDWEQSIQPLLQVLALAGVSEGLKTKVREVNAILRRNAGACDDLTDINKKLGQAAAVEATQRIELLDGLTGRVAELLAAGPLLPSAESRANAVRNELERQRSRLEEELAKLRTDAEKWLEQAQAAQADREALRKLLARPPEAAKSLDDVRERVAQVASQLEQLDQAARQRDELQRNLTELLAKARVSLGSGQFENARQALRSVEGQQEFADLAQQAADLRGQIDTRESEQKAQQRARAQFDELFNRAQELHQAATLEALGEAQGLLTEASGILAPSDEATKRAEALLKDVQARRQSLIEAIAENKRKSKKSLDDAEDHIRHERYSKAEGLALPFAEFEDAEIRERAKAVLATVKTRRGEVGPVLDKWLAEAKELVAARNYSTAEARIVQVAEHDLVTGRQRSAANALREEIRAAKVKEEQERRLAADRLAEARTAMAEGRLDRAAELIKLVSESPFAAGEDHAAADGLVPDLDKLRQADKLFRANEFAQARGLLKKEYPAGAASEHPEAFRAAQALIEQSRKSELAALVEALQKHLDEGEKWESRNQSLAGFSVNVSLRDTAEWVRDSLRPVDTFLQARAGAAGLEPKQAGARIGRKYEIVRTLGRGGMGTTYLAQDLGLDRLVALKMVGPADQVGGLAEALQREAQAICKLDYPKHILHVNNFDTIDGFCCFDTDYKEAVDLAEHVRGRRLAPREAAAILIPVAAALEYAHTQRVFHRDIKPQNILVSRSGEEGPWLIDFGLARISSMCHQHAVGGLCGTPGYMAPEVIKSLGETADDRAADIFSLGCVLFELLTGDLPYQAAGTSGRGRRSSSTFNPARLGAPTPDPTGFVPSGSSDSSPALTPSGAGLPSSTALTGRRGAARLLLNTIQAGQLVVPDAIPEGLRDVCRKALDIDPTRRFESAARFAAALQAFVDTEEQRQREARLTEQKRVYQAAIAKARARFESREQNSPAELTALDEARALVQTATSEAPTGVADGSADALIREIDNTRQQIQQQTADADEQLGLAKVDLANSQWKQAHKRAQFVLSIGYVPKLHAEAQALLEESQSGISSQRKKRLKILGICGVLGVAVAAVGAWLFFVPPAKPTIAFQAVPNTAKATVTIECPSWLATVRYTVDGGEPTASSLAYDAKQGISLDKPGPHVVKARAFKMGRAGSEVAAGEYVIADMVALPTFNPPGGPFAGPVKVKISCDTPGVKIRYSVEGAMAPSPTSGIECQPGSEVEVNSPGTIRAIAYKDGGAVSELARAEFTQMSQAQAPTFDPPGGPAVGPVQVTITCKEAGAKIRYTIDGKTMPSRSIGTEYLPGSRVAVASPGTIQAIAYKEGMTDSQVAKAEFTQMSQVQAPTFDPPGGPAVGPVQVTITCKEAGAKIRYTIDGTTVPSRSVGSEYLPGSRVEMAVPGTIQAIAYKEGMTDSQVAKAEFTQMSQVQTPTFDPPGGPAVGPVQVTITCKEAGAKIRYTIDGKTMPSRSIGTEYLPGSRVAVASPGTIQAIAYKEGMTDSQVAKAEFTQMSQVQAPTFDPPGGPAVGPVQVTITCKEAGVKIRYTIDGTTAPSRSVGTEYQPGSRVAVASPGTIQAIAYKEGMTDSQVAKAEFTQMSQVQTPTFDPPGGPAVGPVQVTITCKEAGVKIRYTIDGTTAPSRSVGTEYQPGSRVAIASPGTIQAIAYKEGMTDSQVAKAEFTQMSQVQAPTFDPPGGPAAGPLQVTISCKDAGAKIRYTIDGKTVPSRSVGTEYRPGSRVEMAVPGTIQAIAYKEGMTDSQVAKGAFTKMEQVAKPEVSPAGGEFAGPVKVKITCKTADVKIRYTLSNTAAPTPSTGTEYQPGTEIEVNVPGVIRAIAYKDSMTASEEGRADFTKKSEPTASAAAQWLARRGKLESQWNSKSAKPGDVIALKQDDAEKYLAEIARIKWGLPESTTPAEALPDSTREFARKLWHENRDLRVVPTHFIEYFWGQGQIVAFLFEADYTPAALQLTGGNTVPVTCIKVADISPQLLQQLNSDPKAAAKAILDPAMKKAVELGFFTTPPVSGSFGLVVSPDGPLLGTDLLGASFSQVKLTGPLSVLQRKSPVPAFAIPLPGTITQLGQLVGKDYANHRTAIWSTVSLRLADQNLDGDKMLQLWKDQFGSLLAKDAPTTIRETATPWSAAAEDQRPSLIRKDE